MKHLTYLLCILIQLCFFVELVFAGPTMISGNISGTWTLAGSPYMVVDDCIVPSGDTLIIEPGVEIILGSDRSFDVYGHIMAVGTKNQQIIFRSANEQSKFAQIYVRNVTSESPISEFKYCHFKNADTGLYIHAYGLVDNVYTNFETKILNCNFEGNQKALYIKAEGVDVSQYMTPRTRHARINPTISGCTFIGNVWGIEIDTTGTTKGSWYAHATTQANINNNYFYNQNETAVYISSHSLNSGYPTITNNTIVNCERGIWINDADFDVLMENNIFYGTTTAIERAGSTSDAYFNSFFNNTTNFTGFPDSYGDIVITNANGVPCDIGFNIFLDPKLKSNDFHIQEDSPCIDAGNDENSPDIDIEGDIRPQLQAIDIGADEFYKKDLFPDAGPNLVICTNICNETVLNGTGSYALSTTITSYEWELNHREDSAFDLTATGAQPNIINPGIGIYDVTLTVTDTTGVQATDQMILTVKETCDPCAIMKGDLDSDGDVDGDDLSIFSSYFGNQTTVTED